MGGKKSMRLQKDLGLIVMPCEIVWVGKIENAFKKDLGLILVRESLPANNGRDQNRVHKARQVADILTAPRQQSDPVHVGWL